METTYPFFPLTSFIQPNITDEMHPCGCPVVRSWLKGIPLYAHDTMYLSWTSELFPVWGYNKHCATNILVLISQDSGPQPFWPGPVS